MNKMKKQKEKELTKKELKTVIKALNFYVYETTHEGLFAGLSKESSDFPVLNSAIEKLKLVLEEKK